MPENPTMTDARSPTFRPARREDARAVAELIAVAGEGIPTFLWSQQAAAGQDPLEIGTARAARDDANFSYRNAVVAEHDGEVAGMVLAYALPAPTQADLDALPEVPDLLRPLVELEYEAPGTFYINALAVRAGSRDRGLGSRLLDAANARARDAGCKQVSVQVFAQNEGALRLYRRHGYQVQDRRPIVPHPCYRYDTEVLLLVRDVE